MPSRRLLRRILIGCLILSTPCWTCIGVGCIRRQVIYTAEDRAHFSVNREGLPSEARHWYAVLEGVTDPESVTDTEAVVIRFPNGEWMVGYCSDSHSFVHRGGTAVVKDSRGQLRVLFGHVCGPRALDWMLSGKPSLDSAYAYLIQDCNFQEQFLAP
jgi:hypothetical protein